MRVMLGLALGLSVAGVPLAGPATAARLDKEACEALKAEQASLVGAGVRDQMAKGPEWAKANLPRDKIAGIQRLIEVEEQIAFRCERPRPAVAAAAAVHESEEPAGAKPAKGQKAAAPEAAGAQGEAQPVPAAKAKGKKARKPKAEDAEAAAAAPAAPAAKEEAPASAPAPAPAPAPKKKATRKPADDAYVAPPRPASEAGVGEAGSGDTGAKVQR